ncbi:O-antigen ligase family protein [Roseateles sp. GG27B]
MNLGLTLFVADIPMVLIFLLACLRWMFCADVPKRHAGWLIFSAVFFIGLAIGLVRNGTSAGVQARPDFYAIAAASYAMSFPIARVQIRQLVSVLLGLSSSLLLICAYRWIVYYGNFSDLLPASGTYNVDGAIRVVGSGAALIIAQALIVGMFFGHLGGVAATTLRGAVPFLAGAVLVLQHRSVWLAGMFGVGVNFLLAGAQRVSRVKQFLMLFAIAIVAMVALTFGGKVTEGIGSSVTSAAKGEGTVAARFENWRVTLTDWRDAGPRAILIGREAGSDTSRTVLNAAGERIRISFGAHNIYVTLLTSTGVIGFGAFVWAIASTLFGLYRRCRMGGDAAVDAALMLVLMAMQLIYYIAYMSDFMQFMILGISLALAHRVIEPTSSASPNEKTVFSARSGFGRGRSAFRP